ncbi:acetolactate synthase 2 small subunit [Endozoicomonas montiporae]|uniref:Acetolactate synthase 2 regulatory subunit n=1 Tax=Endozoicomonas montiporae CL-33 TaxID=570277 RepID=A0A142B980_9GAMM|nr:acetolactate synthase 2 small subunit [Endozoicomonas montiporae]AMO55306.1 acetolactate synthase 2 regulatory subunit [Endozoicomonas montiporae CL-33]
MNTFETASCYAIRIECQKKPEVMERILRTVRHRGFELQTINMTQSDCGEKVHADMTVSGCRPLNFLTSQIEKLYDVLLVAKDSCQQNSDSIHFTSTVSLSL